MFPILPHGLTVITYLTTIAVCLRFTCSLCAHTQTQQHKARRDCLFLLDSHLLSLLSTCCQSAITLAVLFQPPPSSSVCVSLFVSVCRVPPFPLRISPGVL